MLLQRIITAIILIVAVLAGIFYLPDKWFILLATLVVFIAAVEYALFWRQKKTENSELGMTSAEWEQKAWGYFIFAFSPIAMSIMIILAPVFSFLVSLELASILGTSYPLPVLSIAGIWWLIVPYFLIYYARNGKNLLSGVFFRWVTGILVFLPCLVGMIALKTKFGGEYLLYILVAVWGADIGAYFAGRFFGKHKLLESVSPKKTIEGLIGGMVLVLIIAVVGGLLLNFRGQSLGLVVLLIFVAGLWSVIGDLFESMLKRTVNIKDSGCILPGHGGVYDRIDSLTAAIPIFALGMLLFSL